MDTFIWSERFVTGQPQVDDEHQELVRLINRVGTLSAGESGAGGQIADILEALVDYAAVHFAHEEELMERIGCDPRHVDLHKKIHADFASQIVNMRAVSSGPSDIEYCCASSATGWPTTSSAPTRRWSASSATSSPA